MSSRCPSAPASAGLLSLALALPALGGPGTEVKVDAVFGSRVAEAVAEAARRLEMPACAAVLTDFVDRRTGGTLAENLAATERTASEHVASLSFREAPGARLRPGRRPFAYTVPASRDVFLDRGELLRVANQPRLMTAVVIHEVLHTLGLRDDHPSSVAITERVLARCF